MKRVLKYATGADVPENAVYLTTVVQEQQETIDNVTTRMNRFVWHYFLVQE